MKKKFRAPASAVIASLLTLAILVGLGTWQLQRLEWKKNLLTTISAQMEKPPTPLPEQLENPKDWEYRRVTLTGRFDHVHEFLIKPRTRDGVTGYHMLTPFQRLSGGTVFINRGWISDEWLKKAARPQGTIQIEGIVQLPRKTYFTPANVPAKNDWYWPDVSAMGMTAQAKNTAPVVVTVSSAKPGVYPAAGKVEVNVPNNHQQYAMFWFGMALISQIIFFLRFRRAA